MQSLTPAPAWAMATAFTPLVQLLRQELQGAGIAVPGSGPETRAQFTLWYLQVVQLLATHVAGGAAMQRGEVELMCRCALTGNDLRDAIGLCERYCAMLVPRAGRISLSTAEQGVASFRLDSLRQATSTASSLVDITGLFAFQQLFQWLVGMALPLRQVRIGPIERADVLPFLRLFGAPVLAGGEHYALEFEAASLAWPTVRGVGEFDHFFELFPCGIFSDSANSLSQQVSALLTAAVGRGDRLPTQQQLAAALELPLSTFRLRLSAAGTSFRELRQQCLHDAACRLLRRADARVGDIAQQLGYGDPGAFRRAFWQWRGCSPSAWREQQLDSHSCAGLTGARSAVEK